MLGNYYAILQNEKEANFLEADFESLKKKITEILKSCELCERKCGVNREKGEKGYCKAPNHLLISSEFLHFGEEDFLVPSHTIFFMGCNFSCVYCQNWEISGWYEKGYSITPKNLAEIIIRRIEHGAKNVNFVGGEPLPYLKNILEVLEILKERKANIPIVWNSNFYHSKMVSEILNEIVDLYLPDFKYGNNRCARDLSKVENYFETVTRNLLSIDFGRADLCIRHLVLPSHTQCCSFKILDWIKDNLKDKCLINLMDQYRPCFRAKDKDDISRHILAEEFNAVIRKARELGLNYLW